MRFSSHHETWCFSCSPHYSSSSFLLQCTTKYLQNRVDKVGWEKQRSLKKKFALVRERSTAEKKQVAGVRDAERIEAVRRRCKRQIVYDLTKEQRVTEEQRELLSLGLNFGIAP